MNFFMKRFFFILLLFCFLLISCNNRNKVYFGFNQQYYNLSDQEILLEKSKQIVDDYSVRFNHWKTLNIPLNQIIKSDKYKLYISLGLNVKPSQYIDTLRHDTTFKLLNTINNHINDKVYYKNNDEYGCFIIFPSDSNKYLNIFNYLASDSLTINSIFSTQNYLEGKIYRLN